MNILIVGGYGTFGGRLADLLADEDRLTLLIGGRDIEKAQFFCSARNGHAKLVPVAIDRTAPDDVLLNQKPDLVVDASGPFQVYGPQPYAFAKRCIELGANYLDLADGAAFVAGIAELNQGATSKGKFALSGMSSFPVLTSAVVRRLARGLTKVNSIQAGIAPSPFAGVGLNVIRAIASYSGKPVRIMRDGQWTTAAGFHDSRNMVVNVPGTVPLQRIRFALTDVPDITVLSWDWPEAKHIWMGAGPTPAALHRLLWAAAGIVKAGILPSLLPLASIMNFVINTIRWGEHRGGMIVEISGQGPHGTETRSWHLLAEGDGGPFIPSMAAAAIIRNCLADHTPAPGARPGHHDLELEDYQPLLAKHGIVHGFRNNSSGSLYRRVLGNALDQLDTPLLTFHQAEKSFAMAGSADITRGTNFLAYWVAAFIGFPPQGRDVPVRVDIDIADNGETWWRNFAGKTFKSRQFQRRKNADGLLTERFGLASFDLAVTQQNGALELVPRRWRLAGIPMPRWALPNGRAREHGANGHFCFDVDIRLPVIGRLVHYRGHLSPAVKALP